jgi:hypothetical protein
VYSYGVQPYRARLEALPAPAHLQMTTGANRVGKAAPLPPFAPVQSFGICQPAGL